MGLTYLCLQHPAESHRSSKDHFPVLMSFAPFPLLFYSLLEGRESTVGENRRVSCVREA